MIDFALRGCIKLTICAVLAAGAAVFGAVTLSSVRADAVEPCSLLSPGEVAAALGVPEVKTPGGAQRCIWVPKKYAPGPSKSVTLQLDTDKGFAAARSGLQVPGRQVTPVSGIGDDAVQTTTQAIGTVLTVKKGNVYFVLSVTGLPVDQAKTAEQSLAKLIASRV